MDAQREMVPFRDYKIAIDKVKATMELQKVALAAIESISARAESAEAALAALQTPCVWRISTENWYMTGCGKELMTAFPFCPNCGHPVEVQP